MKEYLKITLVTDYAHLILEQSDGYHTLMSETDSTINIELNTKSKLFPLIGLIDKMVAEKYNTILYSSWTFCRKYSLQELNSSRLFQINIRKWYSDSCGKEHGTLYDNSCACPICHSGEHQVSSLYLPKGRYMLHRDVFVTLGNEIVVSKKFVDLCRANNLKGLTFGPVYFGKTLSEDYFQLMNEGQELEVSPQTKFGINPWDFSENGPAVSSSKIWKNGIEIYKCPKGDNLGLNILSEAYVKESPIISEHDFFFSKQTYGVYLGLIIPKHLIFCSPRMRKVIIENQIKGFDFEVAHIVDE